MQQPNFFECDIAPTLADIVALTGAQPAADADLSSRITRLAPLEDAGPGALVFLDNPRYVGVLESSNASACLVAARNAARVPRTTCALVTAEPYRAYAMVAERMYPSSRRPQSNFAATGSSPGVFIHPDARLEEGVVVDPGAVIGPGAAIGSGTIVGSGAVVGAKVQIGRDCSIGPGVTVQYAFIGDRVILHPGVRIGQDGFGFAMGAGGHRKVPQIGRVIIQNDVEIGANSTIDRGANRDTVIGEGTKIDNLVQIGHNVVIGRHCVIVAQVGISGSTVLADYVVIGGQAGVAGHLHVGQGAQIAAQSGVMNNVPAGARWGGSPAEPLADLWRMKAFLGRMMRKSAASRQSGVRGESGGQE